MSIRSQGPSHDHALAALALLAPAPAQAQDELTVYSSRRALSEAGFQAGARPVRRSHSRQPGSTPPGQSRRA